MCGERGAVVMTEQLLPCGECGETRVMSWMVVGVVCGDDGDEMVVLVVITETLTETLVMR